MIIKIGRAPGNDFVIENPTVSREHAVLEIEDGQIVLRDIGSKSGTYVLVNGKPERTTYTVVAENTSIMVGNERLRIHDVVDAASRKSRKVTYVRNPMTGEIEKR